MDQTRAPHLMGQRAKLTLVYTIVASARLTSTPERVTRRRALARILSSMIARVCRLCLQSKPLCRSHIIPEFMYSPVYGATGRTVALIEEFGSMRRRVVEVGHRERLLCDNCERLLSTNYENPNIGLWRAIAQGQSTPPGISVTPIVEAPAFLVSGFNYTSLKLLFLSIFWRASVASAHNYLVKLGEHENLIRLMLLKRQAGPSTVYPCLFYRFAGSAAAANLIRRPVGATQDGWPSYQLLLPGTVLWLVVSRNTAGYHLAPKENGTMHVGLLQADDVPIVQQTLEMLRSNPP